MKFNKKLLSFAMAFLFIFGVFSNLQLTSISAKEENLKIEVRDSDYFNKLIRENKYLSNKIENLTKNNMFIDKTVRTIKGVDFVYYTNFDKSIVGLIQLHKDLNSEIRVNLIDSKANTIEFIKENGNKKILGKDIYGKFNRVIFEDINNMDRSAWWCPYVVGLVGTSVSSLYTAIAASIGGPIAAIIVAGVSSVGWTYVSSKCD